MDKEVIIISDPTYEWAKSMGHFLCSVDFKPIILGSGKEIQKEIYENSEVTTLLLNFETENHSALEVLRYIKSMKPSLRVFMIFDSQKTFEESGLEKNDLIKLGVTSHLIKPFNNQKVSNLLSGGQKFDTWKDTTRSSSEEGPQEIEAEDKQFTRIKLKDFAAGARTVFDHYIKLGNKRYLKILHRGETFSVKRITAYSEKEVEYLYFKSSERTEYINYLNNLISKIALKPNIKTSQKLNMMKMGSELLVEEIYTKGLSPSLMKESKSITEGVQKCLKGNPDLFKLLRNLNEEDPSAYSKAYLTSLFSGMICIQIPWAGKRTADIVGEASFLLDLGILKIPPAERNIDPKLMKPEELKRYHSHPLLSVEMLESYNFISDSVKQVILDHHEYVNGEGYPKGISGVQIFPLAKIVCFASEFAEYILHKKVSPVDGMKELLVAKKSLHKYDAEIVKCFVASLMQKDFASKAS
ncbi:MAG: hypothetical protein CME70_19770 [Halobacteriovorax sp.]|nr:hypothetical protein [Halobacteriovorax sp.]|tara:strand:+ start:16263 stop:17669 length:1407 start_codon:yes stop_codon:yes gene_type:complete